MLPTKDFYWQHICQVLRSIGDLYRFVKTNILGIHFILLDFVPVMFVLIRAPFNDFEKSLLSVVRNNAYSVFCFVLYCTDLLLTGTAMRVLYFKTNQLSSASTVCFAVRGQVQQPKGFSKTQGR